MPAMQPLRRMDTVYRSTRQPVSAPSRCWRVRPTPRAVRNATDPQQQPVAIPASASTIQRHVGTPTTMGAALTGFSLVAAAIFLPANRQASYLSESAMRLLSSAETGAAQAATTQAAASASDPTVSTMSTAVDPAATAMSSPLLDLDQAVHTYVTTHTSLDFRAVAADIYISDLFITAGIFGWLICSAMCVQAAPRKAAGPLALAWAFYFTTCGAYGDGDPALVDFLKHVFARIRPSPMHHTFSFPSGHTSAAVFIVGALVTVLIPLTVQLVAEKRFGSASSSSSSQLVADQAEHSEEHSLASTGAEEPGTGQNSTQTAGSKVAVASNKRFWKRYDVAALSVWGAAWVTTATGRVLADAHWVSDTLAGGCLAIATVSGLAWCCKFLDSGSIDSSDAADRSTAL